jgi:hypothetical protein
MSRSLTPRQSEWAAHVRSWLASGEERETFAEREGVSAKQLGWWRWKLGEMGVAFDNADDDAAAAAPAFIELSATESVTIELVMPSGIVVRVPADFDDDALARMLAVLERGQRC